MERGRYKGRGAAAGILMALLAANVTGVGSARAEDYRLLRIDGSAVAWQPARRDAPFVLTYGIATAPIERHGAQTCPSLQDFGTLLTRSRLELSTLQEAAARAFGRWAAVINVSFEPVPEGGRADILLGAMGSPSGTAFTSLELAPPDSSDTRAITSAVICLNPERRWKVGFDGDLTSFDLEHVFTHEIGHVLGLDHPGARGHVMAFRYLETNATLSDGDIAGAAALYGSRGQPRHAALHAAPLLPPSTPASTR